MYVVYAVADWSWQSGWPAACSNCQSAVFTGETGYDSCWSRFTSGRAEVAGNWTSDKPVSLLAFCYIWVKTRLVCSWWFQWCSYWARFWHLSASVERKIPRDSTGGQGMMRPMGGSNLSPLDIYWLVLILFWKVSKITYSVFRYYITAWHQILMQRNLQHISRRLVLATGCQVALWNACSETTILCID